MFLRNSHFAKSFVLLLVLNSCYIAFSQFYNLAKSFEGYWIYSFFYRESMLFCTYFIAFFLIYQLKIKWLMNSILSFIIACSVILLLVHLFLIYHFDTTLNDYILSVALQSDPRESKEFFISYFDLKFCVLSLLFLLAFYLIYTFTKPLSARGGGLILIIFALLFVFVTSAHIFKFRPYYERSSDVIYNGIASFNSALNTILKSKKEYEKISLHYDDFIKNINIKKASEEDMIENIVLIIGESAQRNLMQIYGYRLENTPYLNEIKAQNPQNLIVFKDVISSRATTYESLSQVLSFANQDNINKDWFECLNLVDAMKLGGYTSINISNQEKFSLFDKASTTIFGRSDKVYWAGLNSSFEYSKPDEKVLPFVDKVVDEKHKALFLSIHLMGNHTVYYNRYPKSFNHFTPQDIHSKYHKKEKAEYANAILYTDFVLNEIIKKFKDQDSLIIYISDHGEDVYDSSNTFAGHVDSKINRFMVEVPFIIYASDIFINKHPNHYKKIQQAQDRPFMLDDLMHAIIDIAGFEIDGFEANRSLFAKDPYFLYDRIRKVGKNAQKDYDKELKNSLSKH